jgi:hypothetical protein
MKFGLYTLLIENHMRKQMVGVPFHFEFGWGNGYVLLPHNHPLYGKNYNDIDVVDIHGGLTFSESFDIKRFPEWIADLEIDGDVTRENYEKFNNYWMIGFDTAHHGDDLNICPKSYVANEAYELLEQCLNDNIEGIKKYKSVYLRKDKLKRIDAMDKGE